VSSQQSLTAARHTASWGTQGSRPGLVYRSARLSLLGVTRTLNKRAQRALGCSPEEKFKGHIGAIYREPLILSTKYW